MYCKLCSFKLKYLCTTCQTLICDNHRCDKGVKKHSELCFDLKVVLLTGEIEYNFWRKYYVSEIRRITKQMKDISIKSKEFISTVEKLSELALKNLEKLKRVYIEIIMKKKFEATEYYFRREQKCKFKVDLSSIIEFYSQFFLEDASFFIKKNILEDCYGLKIEGHTKPITSMEISLDERFAVSGSSDATVRVWDLNKNKQLAIFKAHTDAVLSVCISNDNKHVVSGSSDKTIRVWSLESMKFKYAIECTSKIQCVAMTEDRKHILSGDEKGLITIGILGKEIK